MFVAHDVPALGYATYRILPQRSAATASKETAEDKERTFIENEFYRAAFDLANGAMTSLFDKSEQWEVLAGPANVVAREVDKGDLWELYRGLDGASHIAMTNQQAVPKPGSAHMSNEFSEKNGTVRRGPHPVRDQSIVAARSRHLRGRQLRHACPALRWRAPHRHSDRTGEQ